MITQDEYKKELKELQRKLATDNKLNVNDVCRIEARMLDLRLAIFE